MARAFAALTVLLSHWEGLIHNSVFPRGDGQPIFWQGMIRLFELTFWANGGLHPGVVIFIVLSGFCIHLSYRTEQNNSATIDLNRPEIGIDHNLGYWIRFVVKRGMRIYPVYLLGAILGCIITAIEISGESIVINTYSISINNFILSLLPFYAFAPVEAPQGNGILNTVSVLFAIYITYPLIICLLKSYTWKAVFAFGIIVHLANIWFIIIHADVVWIGRNYYCCLLYWIIGMYAAGKYLDGKNMGSIFNWKIITICSGLSFIAYIVAGNFINFKGAHFFKTLFFAVLTGWFLRVACEKERRISLSNYKIISMLSWIGKRSYSLYAVHLPVIGITMTYMAYFGAEGEVFARIITLCAVGMVMLLSYNYIEYPAQRIMHKRKYRESSK